ncbi:MAG TPA: ATP-binding cassette domain-containing protein [Alphaproteobacteria bacterium]
MAPPILILRDIHLTFGGTPLLESAELSVSSDDKLCLVGRNGSGKSTLLKIAAGMVVPDGGERFVQPGATIRYLPQEPDLSGFATTLDYVEAGLQPGDDKYRAKYLLEQLGLAGAENPVHLSGGEARRCALARTLAPMPDILLLDEPTNHLDLPAIEWLEAELKSLRSALVLVSHDRRFLENLSNATVWLAEGRTRRLQQGFATFEAWRDEIVEQEGRVRHKLDRKIALETEWLRRGVTARRKRNQGRLRALYDLRARRNAERRPAGMSDMTASEAELSGQLVIEAKRISKSYGATTLVSNFSIGVKRGDRIGVVGPNGAGKTTLLNLLTGELKPDSGSIRLGANLQMATLGQNRESLDAESTLAAALTEGKGDVVAVGDRTQHVIGYMKDFLFSPEQALTPVGALSGGERGRLALARALARPSNLLVLDEPTNDLDLETLDLLQEMLGEYAGTVLLVSHDRDFLDRVVTSTLVAEGDGRWVEYAGGYTDMVAQRGGGIAKKADDKPRRPPRSDTSFARSEEARRIRRALSFKEKHALEHLPARIAALQAEIARLQAVLADPGLYARDRAAFEKAASGVSAAQGALAQAEEDWLALELKREEIERA